MKLLEAPKSIVDDPKTVPTKLALAPAVNAPPILQYTEEAVTPPVKTTDALAAKFIAALDYDTEVKKKSFTRNYCDLPNLENEYLSARPIESDFTGEV